MQPEARAAEAGGEAEVEAQEHAQERVRACSNLQGHLWEFGECRSIRRLNVPAPSLACAPPPVDCSAHMHTQECRQEESERFDICACVWLQVEVDVQRSRPSTIPLAFSHDDDRACMVALCKERLSIVKDRKRSLGILQLVQTKAGVLDRRRAEARKLFGLNVTDYATVEDIVQNETEQPYRHYDSSLDEDIADADEPFE